ncbi:ribbon-helix-helix domain-containing protein [Geoglobus ahangari]
MSKQKTEYSRKSEYVNISVSPILKQELEELVELGYFSNVSDAVRYAIHEMLARFRAEGKLPPKTAQERIRNAQLVEEREGEVE